jgi:hypothetical protein
MALIVAPVGAVAHGTELGAALHGSASYPNARGHVDYERDSGHRDLHVEAWNIAHLSGRTVTIYAAGVKVGTAHVGRLGRCHFEHSTDHGQTVPTLGAGDTVRVRTATGTLIVSGILRNHHHMMESSASVRLCRRANPLRLGGYERSHRVARHASASWSR